MDHNFHLIYYSGIFCNTQHEKYLNKQPVTLFKNQNFQRVVITMVLSAE